MRKPFTAANLKELEEHLQERKLQIEENFADPAYPRTEKRRMTFHVDFVPDKKDPDEVDVIILSELKIPKRLGKRTAATLHKGKLVIEDFPEEQPLFDTSRPRVVGGEDE